MTNVPITDHRLNGGFVGSMTGGLSGGFFDVAGTVFGTGVVAGLNGVVAVFTVATGVFVRGAPGILVAAVPLFAER